MRSCRGQVAAQLSWRAEGSNSWTSPVCSQQQADSSSSSTSSGLPSICGGPLGAVSIVQTSVRFAGKPSRAGAEIGAGAGLGSRPGVWHPSTQHAGMHSWGTKVLSKGVGHDVVSRAMDLRWKQGGRTGRQTTSPRDLRQRATQKWIEAKVHFHSSRQQPALTQGLLDSA